MSGPGFGVRGFLQFGHRLPRIPLHVGNAGVGVVRLRGAPLALPTFATAQFKSFFDCGRAIMVLMLMLSSLL